MDSKLQPVQLYGFSKSRLYEPLGTAIFFRNRFCPVSWILVFLPVHFYGYSLYYSGVLAFTGCRMMFCGQAAAMTLLILEKVSSAVTKKAEVKK